MLVAMETESKVVEVALYHVGDFGLGGTEHVSKLILDPVGRTLTRLNMP